MKLVWNPKCSRRWDLLPEELQVIILAWLSCEDLFRSCLLVCKKWKILILFSQTLVKLQYRPSNNLKTLIRMDSEKPHFRYDSHNQVFEVAINPSYTPRFGKAGLICLKQFSVESFMVGNPFINVWRSIALPNPGLSIACLSVDASSSPPSYKILATRWAFLFRLLCTQVYDSKTESWSKGQTLDWEAAAGNEIVCHSAFECDYTGKKIALYDFEQDKWNLLNYVPPESKRQVNFVCCKQGLILVAYPSQCVARLWKANSCCSGVIQWSLMAELDFKAFLLQRGLKVIQVRYGHFKEVVEESLITFTVDLFSEELVLVHYDIIKSSLHFGGLRPYVRGHYVNLIAGLIAP